MHKGTALNNTLKLHRVFKTSYKSISLKKGGGQSWPNGFGLVTQMLQVRVSGPAGIVGGGSECPALSPPSIPRLR